MQRTCRYPLLFDQLLKQTPVYDDPESHAEIDKVLSRLRETTAEINRATDRSETKAVSERTWLLQDRLVHPQNVRDNLPCSQDYRQATMSPLTVEYSGSYTQGGTISFTVYDSDNYSAR